MSVHVRVPPELHEQLKIMADFNSKEISEEAARLLCRGIVASFYEFKVAADRIHSAKVTGAAPTNGERSDDL